MIRIRFEEPTNKAWEDWKEECVVAREKLIREVEKGNKPQISKLYKDERLTSLYKRVARPFHGKCAYCESNVLVSQPGDVEHWRPKGALQDKDGHPIVSQMRSTESGELVVKKHIGYYWLAYDWTNLLLSCATCNRITLLGKHRVGKGAQFPVVDFRAWNPNEEISEQPLLLNPMIDDPVEHMEINREDGIIIPKTPRGCATVKVFGLNMREQLVEARLRCIQDTQLLVDRVKLLLSKGELDDAHWMVARLCSIASGREPYSAAGRVALGESGCATIESLRR